MHTIIIGAKTLAIKPVKPLKLRRDNYIGLYSAQSAQSNQTSTAHMQTSALYA